MADNLEDSAQQSVSNNTNINTVSQPSATQPSDNTQVGTNSGVPPRGNPADAASGVLSSSTLNQGPANSTNPSSAGGTGSGGSSARSNVLHNYANWTYKFSIYAVPVSSINAIYNGITPGSENSVLNGALFVLSDGGYGGNTAPRNYFPNDLGIDNVEIENVVGLNQRSRGQDIYGIKFDIIEPYTSNFLVQLAQAAQATNPNAIWNASFFVLVLDFVGYDDLGKPQKIAGVSKYIPFIFTTMKMKITSSGAVYSCEAMPVSSIGGSLLDNKISGQIDLRGATVQDLFDGEGNSDSNAGNYKDLKANLASFEELKKKNGTQQYPTKYSFKFDPSIGNAKIVDNKKIFNETSISMPDGRDSDQKKAGLSGGIKLDTQTNTFHAQAGTRITDFINSVIKNSDYITRQYDPSGGNNGKPINWWKITPTVYFGPNWDNITNYWQRKIQYIISPTKIYGELVPGFGQQEPQQNDIVKEYDWIYTGKSKDVLDVNVEFQAAFFQIRNGVPSNYIDGARDGNTGEDKTPAASQVKQNGFFNFSWNNLSGDAGQQHTGSNTISNSVIAVNNLMAQILGNQADMVNLDITIVGDPDWISQDMVLYTALQSGSPNNAYWGSSNSVNYSSTRYFKFYFGTPVTDYNDITGLLGANAQFNKFSGIYEVVSVKSNFRNGKFTQTLTNTRVPNQTAPSGPPMRTDGGSSNSSSANKNPPAEQATSTAPTSSNNAYNFGSGNGNSLAPSTNVAQQTNLGTAQNDAAGAQ